MRLPRDISGQELVKRPERFGNRVTRQTGSHIPMTCDHPEVRHVTVPSHNPLRIGTLATIVSDVAAHQRIGREEIVQRLFG